MVKMLCYGHGDTSSNPVRVIVAILTSVIIPYIELFKTTALIAQR
jgi:hypothetical protein